MLIKTSELTGAALDWAVAKCEDFRDGFAIIRVWNNRVTKIIPGDYETREVYTSYSPSTDWSQGGPIIEREMIQLTPKCMVNPLHGWAAAYRSFDEDDDVFALHRKRGKTPLLAAMRCYVASKLGDTVDVPEELTC